MKFVTFMDHETEAVGILNPDGSRIAPLKNLGLCYTDMNDVICRLTREDRERLKGAAEDAYTVCVKDTVLLSPIPRPRQDVICLGLNYTEHAAEAERYSQDSFVKKDRRYAVYFSKRVNVSPGPDGIIPAYEGLVDRLDYEAELAVVIGKDAFGVRAEEAGEYIFGYTVLNDVSARNLQTAHTQWYFGKSLDGFTPMGPVLVTADEIAYPPRLHICSRVNGELRQDSTTDMLITGIGSIIAELSQGMTLLAGTVIATGTPKGVGMGFDPPKWLKRGDVVECEIEGIGNLRNFVR